MKALKCVYCGGLVVRSPEGEYVCSQCGSVQPSTIVGGVKGALSRGFDGASIEEYELPREYIEARKEAVKAWLKEQYVKAIVEVEEAHYGWLWYYSVSKRRDALGDYLRNSIKIQRLTRLIIAVHRIVSNCRVPYPLDKARLQYEARRLGLRARDKYGKDLDYVYEQSDFAILRDSMDVINMLKRLHCEKKCGGSCGRSRGRSGRSSRETRGAGGSPPSTAPG